MAEALSYILGGQSLTFYVEGRPTQVSRDHARFDEILKAVANGDAETAVALSKPALAVQAVLEESSDEFERWFRRKAVKVEVSEYGVVVDGQQINGVLVDRLMEVLRAGLPIDSWVRFIGKLYQNPSSTSRDELYLWLEKGKLPITPDGDFLAFKNVRSNYRDIHSNRFDNSVGQVVQMSRLDVDDDRNRTCSAGLHFCSKDYLPNFSHDANGGHTMIVKINPADVVSIPSDYDNTKGRTWRYEVVGEISQAEIFATSAPSPWAAPVVDSLGDRKFDVADEDDVDYDEYGDEYEFGTYEDEYDPDASADRTLVGKVFAAYAAQYGVQSKTDPERAARLWRAGRILDRAVESFSDLTVAEAEALLDEWEA